MSECISKCTILDGHPDTEILDPEEASKLLRLWHERCLKSAKAHYLASENNYVKSHRLTISNASLSISVIGFMNAGWFKDYILTDGENGSLPVFTITASILGLALVLTTILQYLFRYEDRGRHHKSAGSEFSNLQRKIERHLAGSKFRMWILHSINREYNFITKHYPLVPKDVWENNDFKEVNERIQSMEMDLGFKVLNDTPPSEG